MQTPAEPRTLQTLRRRGPERDAEKLISVKSTQLEYRTQKHVIFESRKQEPIK